MKKTCAAPYVMLVLALIGIADAFYDSYAIFNGLRLWCPPPIDGCNVVADSQYSRLAGIPLGYFGVLYYVCMFGLAALLAFAPLSRGLAWSVLLYTALGVAASAYFMYVQLSFIHAFCIYCSISALLTVLLLIAASRHLRAIPSLQTVG
jgi:uncharacterized membrane protein